MTIKWCFTHNQKILDKDGTRCQLGWTKNPCDIDNMVPIKANTELYERMRCPNDESSKVCKSCHVGGPCEGWLYTRTGEDDRLPRSMMNVSGVTFGNAPDETP